MGLKEFALLKKYGISPIPYFIAKDEKTAIEAAEKLGYPVALKIISPPGKPQNGSWGRKNKHKNHVGVKLAFREFNEAIRTHDLNISGFLVKKWLEKELN